MNETLRNTVPEGQPVTTNIIDLSSHVRKLAVLKEGYDHKRLTNREKDKEKELIDKAFRARERLNNRGFNYSEPILLPNQDFSPNSPFWKREGIIKPTEECFNAINQGIFPPSLTTTNRGVYLFDMGADLLIKNGVIWGSVDTEATQNMMRDLRKYGIIQTHPYVGPESRAGASPYEIEYKVLRQLNRMMSDVINGEAKVENVRLMELLYGFSINPKLIREHSMNIWFGDQDERISDNDIGPDLRLMSTVSNSRIFAMPQYMDHREPLIGYRTKIVYPY